LFVLRDRSGKKNGSISTKITNFIRYELMAWASALDAETDKSIVGGNAVSAFLSWRLQATNACDVTLVWKSGFEAVSQYGISFK
jgi:hypothetical protein